MARTGFISDTDMKTKSGKTAFFLVAAMLVIFTLICFIPSLWMMLSSIKDADEFYAVPPTFIPKKVDLAKIPAVFNKLNFVRYYWNTVIVAAGSAVFAIVPNAVTAYVLAHIKPKGAKLAFSIILAAYMIPGTIYMVPTYMNMINFPLLHISLVNTYWPMWLMAGVSAFNIILFKGFFQGIPVSLLEAAKLDGCGEVGALLHIITPLSKPVMMTVLILTIQAAWGDFFWPMILLKDEKTRTVMVAINGIKNQIANDQLVVALSITAIPPIIFFLIFQKYIMNGFSMSGIKG